MSGGRPRQIYRETVEAAIVLHDAGQPWPEIGCRLKVDPSTIARAVRRGSEHYPSFYLTKGIGARLSPESAPGDAAKPSPDEAGVVL